MRAILIAPALGALLAALLAPPQALSLTPTRAADASSPAMLRAAMVLQTFDHFAAACKQGRGFNAAEQRQVAAWEEAQDARALRQHLAADPLPPRQQQEMAKAVAQITAQPQMQAANPCVAAAAAIKSPAAQFGKLLGDGAPAATALTPTPAATAMVPGGAPAAPASTSKLLAEIDGFAFNTRATMGMGGFVALDIYPVVLFKNGDALTNVKHLAEGGDRASLQRRFAADFTRWRRAGGELQLQDKEDGWTKMPFQTTYARLPDGLRLDGLYRSTSGTGNLAAGGSQSVTTWDDYRFSADGQVMRGGGDGASAQGGDTAVTTGSNRGGHTGRYRVDGLTLHISYADGSSERRILIADPKNTRGTVWIDGEGYVRRDR